MRRSAFGDLYGAGVVARRVDLVSPVVTGQIGRLEAFIFFGDLFHTFNIDLRFYVAGRDIFDIVEALYVGV